MELTRNPRGAVQVVGILAVRPRRWLEEQFQLDLVRAGMVRRQRQSTPIWVGGEATEQG